ncbi:hypothetical protein IMZ08_13805 [Bacillus luteolus]|uniref:Uncharacterized protein n=1 Tax=Litchfieldia luteola TaxID=682179 RepID=A0ABR9QKV6_9BACI|nr:hypothetical protein [Cytobacillus luteolus]MBE4909138.1 hypothetical protein [Cytobacillus luteolus]MBP1940411.1 hypothetical protein [Cytobacillus luteolus]
MFEIGDIVYFEGKEYKILWIYSSGGCELVESSFASAYKTILVHIDSLDKGVNNR